MGDGMKLKIFITAIILLNLTLIAQQEDQFVDSIKSVYVLAKVESNQVTLRWAPPDHIAWNRGNEFGYKIIRYRINLDGNKPIETKQIGNDTIKPISLEGWKSNFPQNHPFAPIAAQALYGKQFTISETRFDATNVRTLSLEQELRYSFALYVADLDADVADALGLRIVDKTIESGDQYLYAIIPHNLSRMDTGFVFVDTRELTEIPKAPSLEKNEMENQIELRWNIENIQQAFTAYWIERSEDGRNWKRLNQTPYLQATQNPDKQPDKYVYFTDTTITRKYLPYKYRIIGITPFADLSEPSDVIEAMVRDVTAPETPVITSIKDVNGKLELEWKLENPPADLKGFLISRSGSIGGQYEQITKDFLSPSTRKFVDNNPDQIGENYYVVFAVDTANNVSASLPVYGFLTDSIPPAKPIGLEGVIDTNGVVTLRWPLGDDPDITGYRVYFANAIDHEFSNLTPYPVQDTVFVDTISLNTLTKEIFYQIAAVDRNFNHSVRSDILKLVKPDIVPPITPLISDYFVSDTAVVLTIVPSTSDDVAKHVLYRKGENENWIEVSTISAYPSDNRIVDKNVSGPKFYQYALEAIDSAGNKSGFSPMVGVKVPRGIKSFEITGFAASFDKKKKVVNLSWNKPSGELKYYVIYRKINGNRLENFASVDANKNSFDDSEIIIQGDYQYAIKGVFSNGESQLTLCSPITIKHE